MKPKHFEKWEKTRAKGKSEFILRDGGLLFGFIGIGIIIPIFQLIIRFITNNFSFSFLNGIFFGEVLFRFFVAFPAGCLWGWIMWEWMEWSYQRAKSKLK